MRRRGNRVRWLVNRRGRRVIVACPLLRGRNGPRVGFTSLSERFLLALLRNASYTEAIEFSSKRITADPTDASNIGFQFRSEVLRLKESNKPDNLKSAIKLIEEIAKMRPPLTGHYADEIAKLQGEIKGMLKGT